MKDKDRSVKSGGGETVKVDGVEWKPPGLGKKARWKTGVSNLKPPSPPFIEFSFIFR